MTVLPTPGSPTTITPLRCCSAVYVDGNHMFLRFVERVALEPHAVEDGGEFAVVEVIQWGEVLDPDSRASAVLCRPMKSTSAASPLMSVISPCSFSSVMVTCGRVRYTSRSVGGFVGFIDVAAFDQLLDRLDRAAHCRATFFGLHDNAVEQPRRQHQRQLPAAWPHHRTHVLNRWRRFQQPLKTCAKLRAIGLHRL